MWGTEAYSSNCPELLENIPVNHINLKEVLGDEFEQYIHKAIINGKMREN